MHPAKRMQPEMEDIFASTALKYRFLFQLADCSSVLLIGHWPAEAVGDFERHFLQVVHAPHLGDVHDIVKGGRKYDFVWLEEAEGEETRPSDADIIKAALRTETSPVVITARNALSIHRIRDLLQLRFPFRWAAFLTSWRYRLALRRSGVKTLRAFLVAPYADVPLDLLDQTADTTDFSYNEGRIGRVMAKLRLYSYTHPRYALVAGREDGLLPGLRRYIDENIQSATGCPARVSIERIMLRARGALVLSLRDETSNKRYVCRVAITKDIDRVISRNIDILKRIHGFPAMQRDHKEKIPYPVAGGDYRGCRIYIETAKPGILAWKIAAAHPARNSRILREALDFVYGLHHATQRGVVVNRQRYESLIGNDLLQLAETLQGLSVDARAVIEIDDRIKHHILNRTAFIVWGHGDYGHGNLLCRTETGRLEGVIDWDTFLSVDLPAIDYLNLLLQQERVARRGSITTALHHLWRDLTTDGPLTAPMVSRYADTFCLTKSDFGLYCCLATIRIMSRAVAYRSEFRRDLADYVGVLDTILDLLPAEPTVVARSTA